MRSRLAIVAVATWAAAVVPSAVLAQRVEGARPRADEIARESGETSPPPRGELVPRDRGEGPERPVELFPRDALGSAVGWEIAREPQPEPSTDEEGSEEALDRWIDDRVREDRIGAGAVDGWYYAMRQRMRAAFRPDRGAMERERRAGMDPVQWGVDELSRYAAPRQSTMDPAGVSPSTIFARSREDEAVQDGFDQRSPLYAPITWYRVELRVVQTRDGRVASVRVTRSSGMRSMDDAAVAAIREGTVSLPPPPESVLGERSSIASEWAFEVGDVATQVGVLGGVDGATGESGEGPQVAALGRGVIRTSVVLLDVADAQHPTSEERATARRRARRARESERRRARR